MDFRVPADEFALGRLFESFPDVEIELERIVPVSSGIIPLVWVSEVDPEEFERDLRADPLVQDVKCLTQVDERALFEINWSPEVDHVVQPLMRTEADLLRGKGAPDNWEFRVQFRDRDRLVAFREACLEHNVHVELLRIYSPRLPTDTQRLTDAQIDALLMAYDAGYWKVPRETNLGALGEAIGISDTAVSQRLRRGINTLVEEYVLPEVDR